MAHARRLTVLLLLLGTGLAYGGPCEEEEQTLGLRLASRAGEPTVAAIGAESPAARSGFRVGDEIWQVNGTVVRACSDWARGLQDARKDRKAVLVLVRRDSGEQALVIGAAVWVPPAPEVVAAPPPPPAPVRPGVPPEAPAPTTPPPTLPPDVPVSSTGVLEELRQLAPAEAAPRSGSLRAYSDALHHVRAEIETLATRHAVPPATLLGLRAVLRYFAGAEVAWKAIEQQRERERRPAHLPVPEEFAVEYFDDSAPAAVLEEFPFLAGTVAREPRQGFTESAGLWRAVQARALLWTRGREAIEQLAAGTPSP